MLVSLLDRLRDELEARNDQRVALEGRLCRESHLRAVEVSGKLATAAEYGRICAQVGRSINCQELCLKLEFFAAWWAVENP